MNLDNPCWCKACSPFLSSNANQSWTTLFSQCKLTHAINLCAKTTIYDLPSDAVDCLSALWFTCKHFFSIYQEHTYKNTCFVCKTTISATSTSEVFILDLDTYSPNKIHKLMGSRELYADGCMCRACDLLCEMYDDDDRLFEFEYHPSCLYSSSRYNQLTKYKYYDRSAFPFGSDMLDLYDEYAYFDTIWDMQVYETNAHQWSNTLYGRGSGCKSKVNRNCRW